MKVVSIKEGPIPQAKAISYSTKKWRFLYTLGFNEYAEMGNLSKAHYRTLASRLSKFNGENSRKLGLRTTDNGVIVYRKV